MAATAASPSSTSSSGAWLTPRRVAHEDHAGRDRARRATPASWPAKQTTSGLAAGRRSQRRAHLGVEGRRRRCATAWCSSIDDAACALRGRRAASSRPRAPRVERLGLGRARVDPHAHVRRDRRERVGLDEQPRRRGHEAGHAARRSVVGGDDQAGGGGERVAALAARVVPAWSATPRSSAWHAHPRGQRADDARRARPPRRPRGSGRCAARGSRAAASSHSGAVREAVRVDAGGGHRLGERRAGVVAAGEHVVDVEAPDERAAAERRRVEAGALLVGERDDGDGRARRGRRPRTPRATPSAPS